MDFLETRSGYTTLEDSKILLCIDVQWLLVVSVVVLGVLSE